ncbi:hypothetical protein [Ruixingdingia sedimenti]|uniref:Cation/multidrug efflux pump n=1 Tax=Ruixingdingia sedimenti TaxID=3073604 RepID=A0ABU1F7X2_9RHOB|nr:hypothetical protein [Xinfangfangia sp. LG-4]MDR5652547.1 hypothetical protein [Xinfangfangia sp. LG-4]
MGYIRLAILGLVGLTVVYVLVSLYSASVRRERLEDRWEAEGRPGDRDAYVERGMQAYRKSFRRKLIVLVYVIPIIAVTVLVYLLNFT